jgi:archaellum component FlaC
MQAQENAVKSEQILSKARNDFEDVKVELNSMSDQFNKVKSMIETQKKFYMYSNEKLALLI